MLKIENILKNRTILMGISMIMIMIFHMNLPIINNNFIKRNLFIGVDMFLFYSGIGIYYSLKKNSNYKTFYKKRMIRILPTVLPVIIVGSFLLYYYRNDFGLKEFYYQISFLNFFTCSGNYLGFLWYIPAIILFYVISPFLFKFIDKDKSSYNEIILLIGCLLLILITLPSNLFTYINSISRLPIYIIGLAYGKKIYEKKEINKNYFIALIILSVLAVFLVRYLENHSSMFTTAGVNICWIPITISISVLLSFIINKKRNMKLLEILTIIGNSTLAIYVLHEMLQYIIDAIVYYYHINIILFTNNYYFSLIVGIITILISIFWTKIVEYNIKKISNQS